MNNKEYLIYDLKINNFKKLNENKIKSSNISSSENEKLLKNYQNFITNWFSYNTPNKCLLVKHDTGLGKTFTSLSTAHQFIEIYKKLYMLDRKNYNYPYIHIVGFTRENFYEELILNPSFGYITYEELTVLNNYKKEYEKDNTILSKSLYDNFYTKIKKRIANKKYDGFYNFYGYGELFNKIFIFSKQSINQIQNDILKNKLTLANKTDINFDILLEAIDKKYISLNFDFLKTFEDSFIICDEIHNVYNSQSLNNYGNALKFIMYYYKNTSLKLLLLSATPINNKPTEVIDLLNILIPQERIKYFNNKYFKRNEYTLLKKDFFNGITLKNTAIPILKNIVDGYVSYASTSGNPNVPSYKFMGSSVPNIKYLKFIKCEISTKYAEFENENKISNPLSVSSVYDIIFPNNVIHSKDLILKFKDKEHQDKKKSNYYLKTNKNINILVGSYLKYENIKAYSPKYHEMLNKIYDNLKNNNGKIFISHQYVNFFGILLIKEILLENGFIMDGNVKDNTPCSICGIIMDKHKQITNHKFKETRFLVMYGEIDLKTRTEILEKYNSKNNTDGYDYRILLGSKFTNEGLNLKAVQQLYIMSVPIDIPTMIQIMGRGIRTMSHSMLPVNKRNVDIFIFINSYKGKITNEGLQYKEKMNTYLEILKVNKILDSQAIDSFINYSNVESIKTLPYKPGKYYEVNAKKINDCNFYFYINEEFQMISYIIKKLFTKYSIVYTHEDLIKNIKIPPFTIEYNMSLVSDINIKSVIDKFLSTGSKYFNLKLLESSNNFKLLKDFNISDISEESSGYNVLNNDYYIYKNGKAYKLVCYDKLYILSEIFSINVEDNLTFNTIKQNIYGYSSENTSIPLNIYNIDDIIKKRTKKYNEIKYSFYMKYKDINPLYYPTSFKDYSLDFHVKLIREVIEYVFYLLTNPNYKISELHNFYMKCVYFYSSINIIIYANQIENTSYYNSYSKFTTKSKKIFGLKKNIENNCQLEKDMALNPFLVKTLLNSSMFSNTFNLDEYNEFIGRFNMSVLSASVSSELLTLHDFSKNYESKYTKINKVYDTLLPVGYFIEDVYLFNPLKENKWNKEQLFTIKKFSDIPEKLNNVYGMYDYSNNKLGLIFKIVDDSGETFKDKRQEKTGINCKSLSKKKLFEITKKLKIPITDSVDNLCENIELYLIRHQLLEDRKVIKEKKKERIRYIYTIYEK